MDFPRKIVTVPGAQPVRLSVIDIGPTDASAPALGTIVCIHGAGGEAEQWKFQIEYFSRRYRVVAPDLRGHAHSDHPNSAYALGEFMNDFAQVLEQLHVAAPFVLMAHSFGGPIALTYAAAQPQQLSKLVLVATAPEMHLNYFYELLLKLPLPLRLIERLKPVMMPNLHAPLFVLQRVLSGTLFPWRGWELLPSIHTPTLIIGGQFDFLVPPPVLQRTRAELANARFELIRYARHLPQLERPDAVNRQIEGFIEHRRSWRGEEEEVEQRE